MPFRLIFRNINLRGILQDGFVTILDEALLTASDKKTANCFVNLKIPEKGNEEPKLEGDNQYKVLITPINWKNNYCYLVNSFIVWFYNGLDCD